MYSLIPVVVGRFNRLLDRKVRDSVEQEASNLDTAENDQAIFRPGGKYYWFYLLAALLLLVFPLTIALFLSNTNAGVWVWSVFYGCIPVFCLVPLSRWFFVVTLSPEAIQVSRFGFKEVIVRSEIRKVWIESSRIVVESETGKKSYIPLFLEDYSTLFGVVGTESGKNTQQVRPLNDSPCR